MQKVQDEIESELAAMKEEKRRLESHIMRTEQWCENVGKWTAHIYDADVRSSDLRYKSCD